MKTSIILLLLVAFAFGKEGFGPTQQEWGYVTVREGAHMFWWLHYTTANVTSAYDRPLVIWLQGGPGGSSTGYGNFEEIGPIDGLMIDRNYSWDKNMNVLFLDNPVGTGFSYVESTTQLTTTNRQIADDFVEFLKGFLTELPRFKEVPLYIFSQSYGGKMAAEMGIAVHEAVQNGVLDCKLRAVALGNAWVHPVYSTLTWGPFLKEMGYISEVSYAAIQLAAQQSEAEFNAGNYYESTTQWARTQQVVFTNTGGIDFYNVLTNIQTNSKNSLKTEAFEPFKPNARLTDQQLNDLMNNRVAPALGINPIWGNQSGAVFDALRVDFMKPVTKIVEQVLNQTNITVAVYSGHLDLICDTPGTIKWVDELEWGNASSWVMLPFEPYTVNNVIEGYQKKLNNLQYYTVLRAGHMAPKDNPNGMFHVLQQVTNNFAV